MYASLTVEAAAKLVPELAHKVDVGPGEAEDRLPVVTDGKDAHVRILGLQRGLDAWGRNLSRHLPSPTGKPAGVPGALSIGVLLALNPLLIPSAVQDGLEHRWFGLALKAALDAVALHAWIRSLSPIRWSLSLLMLAVVLLWQACWTAGAAGVTTTSSVMAVASGTGACAARVMVTGKYSGAPRTCADGSDGIGTSESSSGVQRTAV